MVLEHHPATNEPYIRLPAPLSHIIVTTLRPAAVGQNADEDGDGDEGVEVDDEVLNKPTQSDIAASVAALNDVRVYDSLESPPYPYEPKHAVAFFEREYASTRPMLEQYHKKLQQQKDQGTETEIAWIDGCPLRDIRDTSCLSPSSETEKSSQDDEEIDKLDRALKIGDFMISRYPFYELPLGSEERQKAYEYNYSLPVGHEDLIWGIGFWLSPAYHRKGIMSSVLHALIHDWAIPQMNLRVLKASAFVVNVGSVGVFKRCGFVLERMIEKGSAELSPIKPGGGGKRDIYVMKWERK